jgi:hypothetical protein
MQFFLWPTHCAEASSYISHHNGAKLLERLCSTEWAQIQVDIITAPTYSDEDEGVVVGIKLEVLCHTSHSATGC